jgi:hypothetical protein
MVFCGGNVVLCMAGVVVEQPLIRVRKIRQGIRFIFQISFMAILFMV